MFSILKFARLLRQRLDYDQSTGEEKCDMIHILAKSALAVVNGGNLPPGLIGPGDLFIGHEGCDLRDFSSQQQWLDWTKSDAFPVGNNCWTYLDFTKAGARTRTRSFFSSPKKKKVSNFCWSSVV